MAQEIEVVVIGAGLSGICAGIKLREAGINGFVILEKSPRAGGTWNDNKYPGCACDIPFLLYTYSFAPDATRDVFAPSDDIQAYLLRTADAYGVAPHFRFNTRVDGLAWDSAACRWDVRATNLGDDSRGGGGGGGYRARFVICSTGQLSVPKWPPYVDAATRATAERAWAAHHPATRGSADGGNGATPPTPTVMHSARWDRSVEEGDALAGKTVVVVGNGSSGVQLLESLQPRVKTLVLARRSPKWMLTRLFQRFPRWLLAVLKHALPWRLLLRLLRAFVFALIDLLHVVLASRGWWQRNFRKKLRKEMTRKQPRLQELGLLPSFRPGCNRMILHSDYLVRVAAPNVTVIEDTVVGLAPGGYGLVLEGGRQVAADLVVFATGFDLNNCTPPFPVAGRDGADLAAQWDVARGGPRAYLGVAVPRFPNLFLTYGPNTNTVLGSITFFVECAVGYIVQAIGHAQKQQHAVAEDGGGQYGSGRSAARVALEVSEATVARYYGETVVPCMDGRPEMEECPSWYKPPGAMKLPPGFVSPTNFPGTMTYYWWLTRHFASADYAVTVGRPRM